MFQHGFIYLHVVYLHMDLVNRYQLIGAWIGIYYTVQPTQSSPEFSSILNLFLDLPYHVMQVAFYS